MNNIKTSININFKTLFSLGLAVLVSTFFTLATYNSGIIVANASRGGHDSDEHNCEHANNHNDSDENSNESNDEEDDSTCDSSPSPIPTPVPTPLESPVATPSNSPVATPTASPVATPIPSANLHFIQVLCPSYDVISGNADADKLDATEGNFIHFINYVASIPHFQNPFAQKPVSPSEIPESCTKTSGTSFKISTDEGQSSNVQVVGPTNTDGEINISTSDLNSELQNNLFNNELIWVSEIQNNSIAKFGSLRCHSDAVNGDDLEYIQFDSVPSDIYCISYNVPVVIASPTPSPIASPEVTPTPESSPEASPTPTATVAPEPTPVSTGGGGGGSGGGSSNNGGGSSGGSINPGVGSPQPAEGYVNYGTVGVVAGTSTAGEVLGTSTAGKCIEYLQDYLRMGKNNNPAQVVKLQGFLNSHMNAGLSVTGFFGKETATAVDNFQIKYWDDVLLPWVPFGLKTEKTPTQYVYKTTKWKINMIVCPELNLPRPNLP